MIVWSVMYLVAVGLSIAGAMVAWVLLLAATEG